MSTPEQSFSDGDDAHLLDVARAAFPGKPPDKFGVAVSGGGDSMALLHLFARLQAQRGGALLAVSIDHRLRPESADEARFVAGFCERLGVGHETLIWEHDEILGNLQDQARRARYRLIAGWATKHGIAHVVLGHTADDQAETFLMGLAREAGIDGVSGMRHRWRENGIAWARPLVLTPRAALRDYLLRNDVAWVEDRSNADDRFARIRARKALKALEPLGISVEKLSGVVQNLGMVLEAVRCATADAADRIATTPAGEVVLDRRAFRRLPPELSRRLLIGALRWVSGTGHPPRHVALLRVLDAIGAMRDATLFGCRIRVSENEVRLTREPRAIAGLESPPDALWDGRWQVEGVPEDGARVRALGAEGLRHCPDWRRAGHSRAALIVSPAIWRGAALIAAPLAGLENGWTAKIVADLRSFLITH